MTAWTFEFSLRCYPPAGQRKGSRRMSIGYFLHPNYDAEIARLPTCTGPDRPLRYPPVRAGDMMRQKLEARAARAEAKNPSAPGNIMPTRPLVAATGFGGTISSLGLRQHGCAPLSRFGTKMSIVKSVGRYPEIAGSLRPCRFPSAASGSTASARRNGSAGHRPSTVLPLRAPSLPGSSSRMAPRPWKRPPTSFITLKTDKTVVVVGAQRPVSALSSDAGMNLLGAVASASSPKARGLGALWR